MLTDFEAFLHSLMLRIEFSLEDIREILSSDNHIFPRNVMYYLEKGEELPEAWASAAAHFYDEKDRSFVTGVFTESGSSGPDEEKSRMERNIALCREMILSVREEISTKGKSEAIMPVYIAVVAVLILL